MPPMSLNESGESSGTISLKDLFDGKMPEVQQCDLNIDDIAYFTCRGGWPWATLISKDIALDQAIDYVDSVTQRDIQRVDKWKRNPERTRLFLRKNFQSRYARTNKKQIEQC